MWDDFYGPMSPGEILCELAPHAHNVERATVPQDIPPELERELTALRGLYRKVVVLLERHNAA